MRRWLILVFCFFIFSLAFGEARGSDVSYRLAITSRPSTFDPAKTKDTSSSTILLQLFDPLFLRNPNGEIIPALVKSYTLSEDRRTYHFQLRDNIFFHNKKAITSLDVAYSLQRKIRLGKTNDRGFDVVKGVRDFRLGKTKEVSGLILTSKKTFDIQLNNPFPLFIAMLADVTFSIVPTEFEENIKNNVIVGSGPYILIQNKTDEIILKNFDFYWAGTPQINNIIFKVVTNESSARQMFLENQLDNTHPFTSLVGTQTSWTPYSYMHASVKYLGFNLNQKPLDNLTVRKALLSVLPVEKLHRKLNLKTGYPISHFVPPGLSGYLPRPWISPMSKGEATTILKSVKWPKTITLTNYLPEEEMMEAAEMICRTWKQYQIACEMENVTLDDFIQISGSNQLQVFFGKLMPHIPETYQLLAFFRSESPLNVFHVRNNDIDQLLDQSQQFESPQTRADFYRRINEKIFNEYVVMPLKYMGWQQHYVRKGFTLPPIDVAGPYFQRINNIKLDKETYAKQNQ